MDFEALVVGDEIDALVTAYKLAIAGRKTAVVVEKPWNWNQFGTEALLLENELTAGVGKLREEREFYVSVENHLIVLPFEPEAEVEPQTFYRPRKITWQNQSLDSALEQQFSETVFYRDVAGPIAQKTFGINLSGVSAESLFAKPLIGQKVFSKQAELAESIFEKAKEFGLELISARPMGIDTSSKELFLNGNKKISFEQLFWARPLDEIYSWIGQPLQPAQSLLSSKTIRVCYSFNEDLKLDWTTLLCKAKSYCWKVEKIGERDIVVDIPFREWSALPRDIRELSSLQTGILKTLPNFSPSTKNILGQIGVLDWTRLGVLEVNCWIEPGPWVSGLSTRAFIARIKRFLVKSEIYSCGKAGSWINCSLDDSIVDCDAAIFASENREELSTEFLYSSEFLPIYSKLPSIER